MARDYSLNAILPPPGTALMDADGSLADPWRRFLEAIATATFGPTGDVDVTANIPDGDFVTEVLGDTTNGLSATPTGSPAVSVQLALPQNLKATAGPTFNTITISTSATIAANTVWHAGNDGASSGLDADLLDGQQGSYYLARANHTGTQAWSTITATPTTIAGYGITNAYTKTEVDTAVGGKVTKTTAITDAVTAHDVNATFSDTEVEAALDALGAKINEIIDALNV